MPWVRIDEHFYDHPKWCDAPGDSIALWVVMMAWCNRNDSVEGFVPAQKTRGLLHVKSLTKTLADLCAREAIHAVPGGYLVHDYEEFQQPEKVKEIARKRSANGKKGAAVRWGEVRRAKAHAKAPPLTDRDAIAMANPMANAIANGCPDTDTDTGRKKRSSVLTVVPDLPGLTDDDPYNFILGKIADAKTAQYSPTTNPRGYRHRVFVNTHIEDGKVIRAMLEDTPPATPEQIVLFILGHGSTAEKERAESSTPWCDAACSMCGGSAWIYVDADGNQVDHDTEDAFGPVPCPGRTA